MDNWFSKFIIRQAAQKTVSLAEALSRGMQGPFFHGTDEKGRASIEEKGFEIIDPDDARRKHGYEALGSYYRMTGTPPPIHHLGYGIYLTARKTVAKQFSGGTTRGMKIYYVDAPGMLTINFGSENTMMRWWKEKGYDYDRLAASGMEMERARKEATEHMTEQLRPYGAVYFKGKGLRSLLDGDQICVYDMSLIYGIDKKLSSGKIEPGAKVRRKSDGMTGEIKAVRDAAETREAWGHDTPHPWLNPNTKMLLTIKWKKGGTDFSVQDVNVEPA